MGMDQFATTLGISRPRAARYVAKLAQILNLDGYEVIRKDDSHVFLDSALLDRQFSPAN